MMTSSSLDDYYKRWDRFDPDTALQEEEKEHESFLLGGLLQEDHGFEGSLYHNPSHDHHDHGHGGKPEKPSIAQKQKDMSSTLDNESQVHQILHSEWYQETVEPWESQLYCARLRARDARIRKRILPSEQPQESQSDDGGEETSITLPRRLYLEHSEQVKNHDLNTTDDDDDDDNDDGDEIIKGLSEKVERAQCLKAFMDELVQDVKTLNSKERKGPKQRHNQEKDSLLVEEKQWCDTVLGRIERLLQQYPWLRKGILDSDSGNTAEQDTEATDKQIRDTWPETLSCFVCRALTRMCVYNAHVLWTMRYYGKSFDMLRIILCMDTRNATAWIFRGKVATAFGQFLLADLQFNQAILSKNMREAAIPLDTPNLNSSATTVSVLPTSFEIRPPSCPKEVIASISFLQQQSNAENVDEYKILELLLQGLKNFYGNHNTDTTVPDGTPTVKDLEHMREVLKLCGNTSSGERTLVSLKQSNFSMVDSTSVWGASSWHIFHFLHCYQSFSRILAETTLRKAASRFILNEFRELKVVVEEATSQLNSHSRVEVTPSPYKEYIDDAILRVRILYHEGLHYAAHCLGEMYARFLLGLYLVSGATCNENEDQCVADDPDQFLFDAAEFLVLSATAVGYRYNCQEYMEQLVDSSLDLLLHLKEEDVAVSENQKRRLIRLYTMSSLMKVRLEIKMVHREKAESYYQEARENLQQFHDWTSPTSIEERAAAIPRLESILPRVESHELDSLHDKTRKELYHFTRRHQ